MTNEFFYASAWKDSSDPTNEHTFGLRIPREVRNRLFDRILGKPRNVELIIDNKSVFIPVKPSFWNGCHELQHFRIGRWLIANKLNYWDDRCPPQIPVTHINKNKFKIGEP